jgi:hypothetical protein
MSCESKKKKKKKKVSEEGETDPAALLIPRTLFA